jgi:hypothetical protein
VTGRPGASILAFACQFLEPKVFDQILHRDSRECVCLIGVDGQPPTSHRPFRCGLCLVLVKGAYLSLSTDTTPGWKNMLPTEHPDRGFAPVHIHIKRAILFPRLPHEILLPLRAQNASVLKLYIEKSLMERCLFYMQVVDKHHDSLGRFSLN